MGIATLSKTFEDYMRDIATRCEGDNLEGDALQQCYLDIHNTTKTYMKPCKEVTDDLISPYEMGLVKRLLGNYGGEAREPIPRTKQ